MKLCCNEQLYVIAVISNPVRYQRRYQLFNEFVARMAQNPKVYLFTCELQHSRRPFCTDANLKLRTTHEIWHKENLINLAIERLPPSWKYVAWVDADIEFNRNDWAEETIEQLQHYKVVQLFSHAIDLGPNGETLQVHKGFGYQFAQGNEYTLPKYDFWHPGYAWAIRKETFNAIGGLIDWAILGSADHHMALAMIGLVHKTANAGLYANYKLKLKNFQDLCIKYIEYDMGYVSGTILHYWHGKKKDRRYRERWQILVEQQYDPITDIKRDWQGVYQLTGNKWKLRNALRNYFRCRNEDSIDLE